MRAGHLPTPTPILIPFAVYHREWSREVSRRTCGDGNALTPCVNRMLEQKCQSLANAACKARTSDLNTTHSDISTTIFPRSGKFLFVHATRPLCSDVWLGNKPGSDVWQCRFQEWCHGCNAWAWTCNSAHGDIPTVAKVRIDDNYPLGITS